MKRESTSSPSTRTAASETLERLWEDAKRLRIRHLVQEPMTLLKKIFPQTELMQCRICKIVFLGGSANQIEAHLDRRTARIQGRGTTNCPASSGTTFQGNSSSSNWAKAIKNERNDVEYSLTIKYIFSDHLYKFYFQMNKNTVGILAFTALILTVFITQYSSEKSHHLIRREEAEAF